MLFLGCRERLHTRRAFGMVACVLLAFFSFKYFCKFRANFTQLSTQINDFPQMQRLKFPPKLTTFPQIERLNIPPKSTTFRKFKG